MITVKKRLIFFIGSLNSGGAERVMSILANYFSKNNEILLVTLDDSPSFYTLNNGVKVINLLEGIKTNSKTPTKLITFYKLIYGIKKMKKVRKDFSPNAILCFLDIPSFIGTVSFLGSGVPVLISERNNPILNNVKSQSLLKKISFYLSDIIIFQTESVKKNFSKRIQNKSVVIPNPLNDSLPVSWNGEKEKYIVTVGRLENQKNHELLLHSFSKIYKDFPNYKVMIFGEGSKRKFLEELSVQLGIAHKVEMPGNKKDVLERISKASLFVFTSKYEGFPNALLEAMALGLPVISTDCLYGPSELIRNNKNGILVHVDEPEDLAIAMHKVLNNKIFSNQLSIEAQKVRETYSTNSICNIWDEILSKYIR